MHIVFIHGMNQQQLNAQSLRKHWLSVLKHGLSQNHLLFQFDSHQLHFPFYGDLLTQFHLSNRLDLDTFLPKSLLSLHLPAHLHIPSFALFKGKQASGHTHLFDLAMIKKKLLDERLTAKDQSLKELMILLDHFPKLHEELMHTFLIESYCYLANQSFMQRVHQRIRIGIPVQQPCIIVAHSLGSVIAYNLLRQMCNISNIQGFITLGSPLAFRVIQQHLIQPISYPECLHGVWHNFYSHDDFLTAFPLEKPPFDFDPPILNHEISTSSAHPHEISGYLQNIEVLKALIESCQSR